MAIIQILEIGPKSAWNFPEDHAMLIGAVFETTSETLLSPNCARHLKPLKMANETKILLNEYSFYDIEYKILFK